MPAVPPGDRLPKHWPGWLLIGLGVISWLGNATTPDRPASTAEALGRMSVSIALLVGGAMLVGRAHRRARERRQDG